VIKLGPEGDITAIAINPNGESIFTGIDGIQQWNTAHLSLERILLPHHEKVTSLVVSPNGRSLAAGFEDGAIRIWNLEDFSCQNLSDQDNPPHRDEVSALKFSPDSQRLVSVSWDKTLRIWNACNGQSIGIIQAHSSSIYGVDLYSDGRYAITCSKDSTLKIWDLENLLPFQMAEGHDARVDALALSPHADLAVSGSVNGILKIWDVPTRKVRWSVQAHTGGIFTAGFDIQRNLVISAGDDQTIRTWDINTGKQVDCIPADWGGFLPNVSIARNGGLVVSVNSGYLDWSKKERPTEKTLTAWDVKRKKKWRTAKNIYGNSIAISPDRTLAIAVNSNQEVQLIDIKSFRQIDTFRLKSSKGNKKARYITTIAINNDNRLVVFGKVLGSIEVWDVIEKKLKYSLGFHRDKISAISISTLTGLVCSASAQTMCVWRLDDGELIATFYGDESWGTCYASDDGSLFLGGDGSGQVHFLRLEGLDERDKQIQ
jgi:WD40 repeat protein